MAINGVVYSGQEVKFGLSQEATFGTPIADSGAFVQIPNFGSVSVDYGLFSDHEPKHRDGAGAHTDDTYVSETGGTRTITVSDIEIGLTELAELMYGVTQDVTEAAGTPFEKQFKLFETQPNFAADAGYFVTLAIDTGITNQSFKFTSCILKQLTISADMVGGDGRLRATAVFISGFAIDETANFTGTWTIGTRTFFDYNQMTAKSHNANDLVIYSFDLDITNNAVRVGNDSSGDCETYGILNKVVTGTITVKDDANSAAIRTDMKNGTGRTVMLTVGTVDNTGYVHLLLYNTHVLDVPLDLDRAEGQALPISYQVKNGSSVPIIYVDDGVDQTW